jgi:hypothetical protein
MDKIEDYIIVESESHLLLSRAVCKWIKLGYVPFGGAYSVSYVVMQGRNVWHYQPMMKYESKKSRKGKV